MFFEGFFANENPPTSIEKQELVSEMLVAMVWADGHAHSAQLQSIIHILARWFHVAEDEVRKKISGFSGLDQKEIQGIAKQLCRCMPARERVLLLKDLWSIAGSNGVIDPYEQDLFHRVANLLQISEGPFLDNCIKMTRSRTARF